MANINIISNFLIYSPLEQFEICVFNLNSWLQYEVTFPLEFFEINFFVKNIYFNDGFFFDVVLYYTLILQAFIKPQLHTPLNLKFTILKLIAIFSTVYILLLNFNLYSFTDIVLQNVTFIKFGPKFVKMIEYQYLTLLTSSINIYSVLFCILLIYIFIYMCFNKLLSNNSNSLLPNLYQMLSENLFKISLNLFYSILGKRLASPELFLKINTIFIFLIFSNIQGMIPYVNTLTSVLTNTFFITLALFISILTTLFDKKGFNYFLKLFLPSGCPILLTMLIIPIELISYGFRLISLSVRLFANMMAGHTLLKVIAGFSWILVFLTGSLIINFFPILILGTLTGLEIGVALIQAYIFTILSCIYIRDIFAAH